VVSVAIAAIVAIMWPPGGGGGGFWALFRRLFASFSAILAKNWPQESVWASFGSTPLPLGKY